MKKRYSIVLIIMAMLMLVSACGKKDPVEEIISDQTHDKVYLPGFKLMDTRGNEVSSDVMKDYDMTIIGLWQST